MSSKKGFTLIELLVVIGLVSIISFIAVPFSISQISDNRAYEAAAEITSAIFLYQQFAYANKDGKNYSIEIENDGYNIVNGLPETSTDIIGYWSLDERNWNNTDGEVLNSWGDSNNGVTVGNVKSIPGGFNRYAFFEGDNDYIDLGEIDGLVNISEFTISLWLYRESSSTQRVFHIGTGSDDISIAPWNSNLYFEVGNGSNSYGLWTYDSTFDDTWNHIVAVYDGGASGNSGKLKLFVNNEEKTLTFTGTIPNSTSASLSGQAAFLGSAGAGNYFDGRLDELKIYSYALSTEEISNLYNYNSREVTVTEYENPSEVESNVVSQDSILTFNGSSFRPFRPVSFNISSGPSDVFVEVNSEGLINYYVDN